ERASVEREIARQIRRPLHIERRLTRCGSLDRKQSCAAEAWVEQPFGDGRDAGPTRTQRIGQLTEPRLELLCLTLQREPIASWFELFQKRLHRFRNRDLGSIVSFVVDLRCFGNVR